MLGLSSDLQTKGFALFQDKEFKYEIGAAEKIDIGAGGELEFYLGVRHETENHKRICKAIILEENYRSLFLDIAQEHQGEYFRRFDAVESIEIETVFDAHGLLRNILYSMRNKQFYSVLEFISRGHMGDLENIKCKWCVWSKIMLYGKARCPMQGEPSYLIWTPSGYWEDGKWPTGNQYFFYSNFFVDDKEDYVSAFDQYCASEELRNKIRYIYSVSGFKGSRNYNFINDIRPEIIDLLTIRWKNGSNDIHANELREASRQIYDRLEAWYGKHTILYDRPNTSECQYMIEGELYFTADWLTVHYNTTLGRISTCDQFARNEPILTSLLGEKESVGGCSYVYGTVHNYPDVDNTFKILRSTIYQGYNSEYRISEEYDEFCEQNLVEANGLKAYFSIFYSSGRMGQKKVFDGGMGTEFKYYMVFEQFLEQRGWTIDDFMDEYEPLINARKKDLEDLLTTDEPVDIKLYSEFNSIYNKSPFDNIGYYVPIPLTMEDGSVLITKRIVTVNEFGGLETAFSETEQLGKSEFIGTINKDEYVSAVTVSDSIRVFLSDFMHTRVKIKFKENMIQTNDLQIRLTTSDMTFMQQRKFTYEST